ncbi:MAG: ribose-phosphate pyrophosphokinase [Candidatus Moranbacteria bacterium]|nr:ribose-phosphate pyrophosphokinase [Candidatus Moranbacteria bacterium]
MNLFATNSNCDLAKIISSKTTLIIGKCKITKFADQEISVFIEEDVTNQEVWVLGSTFPPADNMLELLILIHTLKSNGAMKVNVIIPYFAYAKADQVKPPGASLAAQLITQAIELSGADTITAINIHSERTINFFTKPLTHLSAISLLAKHFQEKNIKNLCVASPDSGGIKRAQQFANELEIDQLVITEKHRPAFDQVEILRVSGDVKHKNVIIVDDMIQSGGTIIESARALKEKGAKKIYVAVTHLVSTGPSIVLLKKERSIKKIVITDTIPQKEKLPSKFEVVSVADLISNSIGK